MKYSNEACTTLAVGTAMTADGSRIYARSDDSTSKNAVNLAIYKDSDNGPKEFKAIDSPFRCDLPSKRLGYSAVGRTGLPGHWGEAGFNSAGVGMSATETIFSNEKVLATDPYVPDGLGENCVYDIVLPYVTSAREGVKRLGSLIEKHGSAEGFGIAFMDADELWYLENAGGHRWLARRLPEDVYFVSGNQSRYREYNPKDKRNYLASKDLIEFAVQNGLYDPAKGDFDFHEAYSLESENDKTYNYPRVWGVQKLLTPSVKTNVKVNDFPVFQKADRPITLSDVRDVFRFHYDGTSHDPYLHSNPKEPYRPVSIFRTINTHILQIRPWLPKEIGCVNYMAEGMADLSVFLPLYQGVGSYAKPWLVGGKESSANSAYWKFRKVSVLAMTDYNAYAPVVKKAFADLEAENDQRQKEMEEEYLAMYTSRPIAAREMLQRFSDRMMAKSLEVADSLQEELFTRLTADIEKTYRFHGA